MIEKLDKKNEKTMVFLCALIVCALHIHGVYKIFYPCIIDEIGYWGVAASLQGYDWSEVMANVPYYSYGYSFIIAILIAFIKDSVLVYQMQIVLNGIFLAGSFVLAYDVSKKLFQSVDRKYLLLISMTVNVYSGHLVLTNTGLTEGLLILLCWMNVLLVYNYVNRNQIKYLISIIIISIYAYTVHQRMLAMIFASVVVIILKIFSDKSINWKRIFCILFIAAGILLVGVFIKNIFISDVWSNTDEAYRNINDYSVQFEKIKGLFDLKILFETVQELLGLVFYIGIATFGTAYIGLFDVIKNAINYFKGKKENFIYVYIGLLFLGLLGISTIYYSAGIDRADQAVYGRYIEVSYGIIVLVGLKKLLELSKKNILYSLSVPFWMATGWMVDERIARYGVGELYSEGSAVALSWFYKELGWDMKRIAVVMSIIFLVLFVTAVYGKKLFKYMTVVFIMGWFIIVGLHVKESYIYERQKDYRENYSVVGRINEMNDELPVYFLDYNDGKSKNWMHYVQFELLSKKIEIASMEEILGDTSEKFVITSTKNNLLRTMGLGEYYDVVAVGNKYTLYLSKGATNDKYVSAGNAYVDVNERLRIPFGAFTIVKGKYDSNKDIIISNGKKGRLIKGFKQYAHAREYKYQYEMELIEATNEEIGKFLVKMNGQVVEEIPLYQTEFENQLLNKTIVCDMKQEGQLEVALELQKGSVVSIKNLWIQ